jgi:hypothetical protein
VLGKCTLPISPFAISPHYNTSCKLVICASLFFYKETPAIKKFPVKISASGSTEWKVSQKIPVINVAILKNSWVFPSVSNCNRFESEVYIFFTARIYTKTVHLQDDRAHGKWLLSYRDEQGNVGSSRALPGFAVHWIWSVWFSLV